MRRFIVVFCGLVLGASSLVLSPAGAFATEASPSLAPALSMHNELLRLYFTEVRVQDLLRTLHPKSWKMTHAERSAFNHKVKAARSSVQYVDKWRYQFLYHPQDANAAKRLLDALTGLTSSLQAIHSAVAEYQSHAASRPFAQSVEDLTKLAGEVNTYGAKAFPSQFKRQAPSFASVARHPAPAVTSARPKPQSAATAVAIIPKHPVPAIPKHPVSVIPKPSAPQTPAAPLEPGQVKSLLLKVYLATARIHDLLSLAQPGAWKMSDAQRGAFNGQVQSLKSQLTQLEKWRYQLLYHPESEQLADRTAAALKGVIPSLQNVAAAESQFESPAAGAQFEQPWKQLAEADKSLNSYAAYLELEYQKELSAQPPGTSGPAGLQTVRIGASALPAPLTSISVATPPLRPSQVKSILFRIYFYVYRIHDLLTQEHPEAWKAPHAERKAESLALSTALARIQNEEKWRALFSESPANMYYAFQAYRSIESLFQPLGAFSRGAGQFENPTLNAVYGKPAAGIQSSLDQLIPYISFILQHESDNVFLYQTDLASCQNQLTYAMRSSLHRATPMRNVLPVFQGRRVRRRAAKRRADKRPHKER